MRSRVIATLAAAGCSAPGAVVLPESMSATGYAAVSIDLSRTTWAADDVTALRVGDLPAYDLAGDGDVLTAQVQGGPPGEAEIIATIGGQDVVLGTLTYEGPVDPVFDRFVMFGASLSQGTRDAVPTASSQLGGPGVHLARAASAHFPLPLLNDPLTPMSIDRKSVV